MKNAMMRDAKANELVEYNSKHGLALLFQKCGGKLSERMETSINSVSMVTI